MFKETKLRSAVKTVSWRTLATLTTAVLVFIFTGELAIAIAIGSLEVIAKIVLYFFHERIWNKIKFGRKEVTPFVLWLTGLPSSGKVAIAEAVSSKLREYSYIVQRLDGETTRALIPKIGFSKSDRDMHIKRVGLLASILEKNKVIVIASFVSPYKQVRNFVREICTNFIEVYVNTPLEICEQNDNRGLYKEARAGRIENFTGINDPYEEPQHPEILLKTQEYSLDECVDRVIEYLHNRKFLI